MHDSLMQHRRLARQTTATCRFAQCVSYGNVHLEPVGFWSLLELALEFTLYTFAGTGERNANGTAKAPFVIKRSARLIKKSASSAVLQTARTRAVRPVLPV